MDFVETCLRCKHPDRMHGAGSDGEPLGCKFCPCIVFSSVSERLAYTGLRVEERPTFTDLSKPEGTVGRVRTHLRLVPNS